MLADNLSANIAASVQQLSGRIKAIDIAARTHRAVVLDGWETHSDTPTLIAWYLVGLRADVVSYSLDIISDLLADTKPNRDEIICNVLQITELGDTTRSITYDRNPWIAEGIAHLCLCLARQEKSIHPMGEVLVVEKVHINPKDHGPDILAIYQSNQELWISIFDAKATQENVDDAISAAVGFFGDVLQGKHMLNLRQTVNRAAPLLTPLYRDQIAHAFWNIRRTFIPNIYYESSASNSPTWSRARPSLAASKLQKVPVVVYPVPLKAYGAFFNAIAAEMERIVRTL